MPRPRKRGRRHRSKNFLLLPMKPASLGFHGGPRGGFPSPRETHCIGLSRGPQRGNDGRIRYRGVAQLVARLVRDQEAGCSSHLTPTTAEKSCDPSVFKGRRAFCMRKTDRTATAKKKRFGALKWTPKQVSFGSAVHTKVMTNGSRTHVAPYGARSSFWQAGLRPGKEKPAGDTRACSDLFIRG